MTLRFLFMVLIITLSMAKRTRKDRPLNYSDDVFVKNIYYQWVKEITLTTYFRQRGK